MTRKPLPQSLKQCSACHETKPIDDFGMNRTRTDGRQHVCRECRKRPEALPRGLRSALDAAQGATDPPPRGRRGWHAGQVDPEWDNQ